MIQGACNMNGFFVRLAIPTVLASIVLILTTGKPAQGQAPPAGTSAALSPSPVIARMTIARDDARNYIVLGDPATQLRIRDLK